MSRSSLDTSDAFGPGDVVSIYAPTTGYPKYHLCICTVIENGVAQFLYLNSGSSGRTYESDYVLATEQVPCVPTSATGMTIVSCNALPKYTARHLQLYNAKRLGAFPKELIPGLLDFVRTCGALTRGEQRLIEASLSPLLIADFPPD